MKCHRNPLVRSAFNPRAGPMQKLRELLTISSYPDFVDVVCIITCAYNIFCVFVASLFLLLEASQALDVLLSELGSVAAEAEKQCGAKAFCAVAVGWSDAEAFCVWFLRLV